MKKLIANILFKIINKVICILSLIFQYLLIFLLFLFFTLVLIFLLGLNLIRKLHVVNYKFFKKENVNVFISNERWKKDKSFYS